MTFVPSIQGIRSSDAGKEVKKSPAMMNAKARIEGIWGGREVVPQEAMSSLEDREFRLEHPILEELDEGFFARAMYEFNPSI
jgi:hypothetical protein